MAVEVVNQIVDLCKSNYGDRFNFYLTGSYARNEENFKDYDIAIYDNKNDKNEWENLLYLFNNQVENDGKYIDAQIDQMTKVIKRMSGDSLYKNRNELVKRYVYSKENLKSNEYIKYTNIYGNLWEKEIILVKHKHQSMGLDRVQRIYREL